MSVRSRVKTDQQGRASRVWFIDIKFQHADGRIERIRKDSPVNTRRGAEEYERQVRELLLAGKSPNALDEKHVEIPTFNGFVAEFLTYSETNNKPSTVHAKRWILDMHLKPYFGRMRLADIGPKEVERYKAEKLKDKQSGKSINNHLAVLRKILNLAAEWQLISHAPKLKALRLADPDFTFLTFDEAERFLAAAPAEWRTFLTIALKTGLRVGELLALKWEDIDLKAGRLLVKRTLWQDIEGTPKGGRFREIPLSRKTVAVLEAHRHLRGPYVFCAPDGSRLTHSMVKNVVPMVCKKAGLAKRLTTHDLRHSFASHLVMRGRSIKEVQELLGHQSLQMTMRYAHLAPDVRRDAVEALDLPPRGYMGATGAESEAAGP